MVKVRQGVFETNSSSTHSITMCTKDTFNDWKAGKLYWDRYGDGAFKTKEELVAEFEKKAKKKNDSSYTFEEFISDEYLYTFDDYNNINLEDFYDEFTTPNGETVIAFGYYGYCG